MYLCELDIQKIGFKKVGRNVLISSKCSFYNASNISIGSNVRIDDFCTISAGSGGVFIGNNIHIAVYTSLIGRGKIVVSDYANISSRVSIFSSNDDYSGEWMTGPVVSSRYTNIKCANVVIKKHVIIGCGTVILPGVVIGTGCAVGALSLVKKSCDDFFIYAGCPAKKVSPRSSNLLELETKFKNDKCHE